MENLFLKLIEKISVPEQIKILRRNILPEYSRSLALQSFRSVEELKEACKTLEHTFKETSKGKQKHENPFSRGVNMIAEPEEIRDFPRRQNNQSYRGGRFSWRNRYSYPQDDQNERSRYRASRGVNTHREGSQSRRVFVQSNSRTIRGTANNTCNIPQNHRNHERASGAADCQGNALGAAVHGPTAGSDEEIQGPRLT